MYCAGSRHRLSSTCDTNGACLRHRMSSTCDTNDVAFRHRMSPTCDTNDASFRHRCLLTDASRLTACKPVAAHRGQDHKLVVWRVGWNCGAVLGFAIGPLAAEPTRSAFAYGHHAWTVIYARPAVPSPLLWCSSQVLQGSAPRASSCSRSTP